METPYRGERASQPAFMAPAIVLAAIAVLAAVYLALLLAGEDWQVWSLYAFAVIPARFTDGLYPFIPGSKYWSLVTYAFLHDGWQHLAFNCIWLLVFGTPVARLLGNGRFVLLALTSAIGGGLASLALHWGERMIMVGASGAVSGLLAAAIPIMYGHRILAPGSRSSHLPLTFSELVRDGRALAFSAVFMALTLFSGATGWTGNSFAGEGAIAWEAHVGGFVSGLAVFYALLRSIMRGG